MSEGVAEFEVHWDASRLSLLNLLHDNVVPLSFRFSLVDVGPRFLSIFFDLMESQFVDLTGEVSRVFDVMGCVPHHGSWDGGEVLGNVVGG